MLCYMHPGKILKIEENYLHLYTRKPLPNHQQTFFKTLYYFLILYIQQTTKPRRITSEMHCFHKSQVPHSSQHHQHTAYV